MKYESDKRSLETDEDVRLRFKDTLRGIETKNKKTEENTKWNAEATLVEQKN